MSIDIRQDYLQFILKTAELMNEIVRKKYQSAK